MKEGLYYLYPPYVSLLKMLLLMAFYFSTCPIVTLCVWMCLAHTFVSEALRKMEQSKLEQRTLLNAVNEHALFFDNVQLKIILLIAIKRIYFPGQINFEYHFIILS